VYIYNLTYLNPGLWFRNLTNVNLTQNPTTSFWINQNTPH